VKHSAASLPMRSRPSSAMVATSPMLSGAQVGEFRRFEVAPDLFDWIGVRRRPRQRLDAQPVALAGDPLQHASAAMRGQAVPDQHATMLDMVHIGQEVNERFVAVGARTPLEDEVSIAAIGSHARAPANDSRFQANR
jgi:hypothetical protein